MQLTAENYFSREADLAYMSNSQFKAFLKCPFGALAKLNEEAEEPPKLPFEFGGWVDRALLTPERLEAFECEHYEAMQETGMLSKTNGTDNAPMKTARRMVKVAAADPVFVSYLKGGHQVILTCKIAGVPFKCALDVLNPARIVDLKTAASLTKEDWLDNRTIFDRMDPDASPHMWRKALFYNCYQYDIQGAIYQYAVEYNTNARLPFFISALSKEPITDKEIYHFDDRVLAEKLAFVASHVPQIQRWKTGVDEAPRCGVCDYCRSTKMLSGPVEAVGVNY